MHELRQNVSLEDLGGVARRRFLKAGVGAYISGWVRMILEGAWGGGAGANGHSARASCRVASPSARGQALHESAPRL